MFSNNGSQHAELNLIGLSPAARYGLQGMAFIAEHGDGAHHFSEKVAESRGLPKNFLSKIFQRLRRAGILVGRRGPGGGYRLARPATQITLAEIIAAIEPPPEIPDCLLETKSCGDGLPCALHNTFVAAERSLLDTLAGMSLADLIQSNGRQS